MHTVIFSNNKNVVCTVGIKEEKRKEKELSVPAFGVTIPVNQKSQCSIRTPVGGLSQTPWTGAQGLLQLLCHYLLGLETAIAIGQPPESPVLVKRPVVPCKIRS